MALTRDQIAATTNDEALFDLLSAELKLCLPPELQEDPDRLYSMLPNLPRGLRAMASMHFFDVSMALDDLAWHFGNQNDERALRETYDGLVELELPRIAELFRETWTIMEPHLPTIRSGSITAASFHEWLEEIGAQAKIDPMNDEIWAFCKSEGDLGLLQSWPRYARKYPERCIDLLS